MILRLLRFMRFLLLLLQRRWALMIFLSILFSILFLTFISDLLDAPMFRYVFASLDALFICELSSYLPRQRAFCQMVIYMRL